MRNSLDLARHAEALGYTRYWVAEHHNLSNIASSAPDIMIGQIAAATSRIRVGSGGVMLPNHAPLTVTERFKVLEALFPGRIDLGIGRAPGTDQITSIALRRRQDIGDDDDFLERLQELLLIESKGFPESHPFSNVRAMPADVPCRRFFCWDRAITAPGLPPRSAPDFLSRIISRAMTPPTRCEAIAPISAPRRCLTKPYAILAVAAVCAESEGEAERIAATADLNIVRRANGDYLPLESPEAALAHPYAPIDRDRISQNRERLFVGTPAAVKDAADVARRGDGGG